MHGDYTYTNMLSSMLYGCTVIIHVPLPRPFRRFHAMLGNTSPVSHALNFLSTQVFSTIMMKYLQCQNQMLLPGLVTILTFGINIGLNKLLISKFGFKVSQQA